jgi:hypothetical protein
LTQFDNTYQQAKKMKNTLLILTFFLCLGAIKAQDVESFYLKNKDLKFTAEPEAGHWMDWMVYPKQELYDWFLIHDKRIKL